MKGGMIQNAWGFKFGEGGTWSYWVQNYFIYDV